MSIFVLRPNESHSSWQSEKLSGVFQVSSVFDRIFMKYFQYFSQLLESSNFKPNMIDEETMLHMKDIKGKLFVIEPFSGQLFQYLKNHKAW